MSGFSFSSQNWRKEFQISLSPLDFTILPLVIACTCPKYSSPGNLDLELISQTLVLVGDSVISVVKTQLNSVQEMIIIGEKIISTVLTSACRTSSSPGYPWKDDPGSAAWAAQQQCHLTLRSSRFHSSQKAASLSCLF